MPLPFEPFQHLEEENSWGPQPGGTIPVTMDILGMYTNIPWQEGTDAFKEAMEQRVCKAVPTVFLITLLHLILSCNLFTFDGTLFLQLFGFAMGTRVAPTFACLFIGWLEKKMLQDWRGHPPRLWRRYIDNIIFLWSGSKSELLEFVKFLNEYHPTIKFKYKEGEHFDFETRSVNFLDTTLYIDTS